MVSGLVGPACLDASSKSNVSDCFKDSFGRTLHAYTTSSFGKHYLIRFRREGLLHSFVSSLKVATVS
jgi:hypothetical protein